MLTPMHLLAPLSRPRLSGCRHVVWLAAALSAFPSIAPAQNMFRVDPAHTGIFKADGPKTLKGVKWAFKTGGPVISSPVLADGTLYIGSDDQNLYAIDLVSGAEKWKFATGGPIRSTPAVVDGLVFFASYDGTFYALEAVDGKVAWKFDIPGERKFAAPGLHGYLPRQQVIPDFWDCYQSSAVVGAGIVYFGCGDGNVYALDAKTGAEKWKFTTGDVVHASPALVDGTLYFGSWDTFFYALDAATGEVKWKFKTGDDAKNYNQTGLPSSPCVVDGTVYFGCRDSHLYAVDAKTGVEKWKYKITWVIASPAVRDGRVYCNTSIPAVFFALDAATGKEIYKVDLKIPAFSSPALAGELAYVGSFNGKLYAIDLAAGKIAWEFQTEAAKKDAFGVLTPEGGFNPKAVFTSRLYENMYVSADRLFSLGSILSSPAVADGIVYVGSADGNLYALE
jgi:eukaryotic-like serine/threonine-protein kinase